MNEIQPGIESILAALAAGGIPFGNLGATSILPTETSPLPVPTSQDVAMQQILRALQGGAFNQ
jgi:ABC-type taurine transport system substrate-binding protein